MIPAHTSGRALKASLLFLQFMSARSTSGNGWPRPGASPRSRASPRQRPRPPTSRAPGPNRRSSTRLPAAVTTSPRECCSARPTTATYSARKRSARKCPTWRACSARVPRTLSRTTAGAANLGRHRYPDRRSQAGANNGPTPPRDGRASGLRPGARRSPRRIVEVPSLLGWAVRCCRPRCALPRIMTFLASGKTLLSPSSEAVSAGAPGATEEKDIAR